MEANKVIEYYRKQKGLSPNQIAEYINVPLSEYESYENGSRWPNHNILERLAEIFNIEPYLIEGANIVDSDETVTDKKNGFRNPYLTEIGLRIRYLRMEFGLTQQELADRCGYTSRSSINKIELGLNDIPQSKIKQIADVLQVPVSKILGDASSNFMTGAERNQLLYEIQQLHDRISELEDEVEERTEERDDARWALSDAKSEAEQAILREDRANQSVQLLQTELGNLKNELEQLKHSESDVFQTIEERYGNDASYVIQAFLMLDPKDQGKIIERITILIDGGV